MYPIHDVTPLDIAFGGKIDELMPKYNNDIPDEFRRGHTKWNRMVSDWFFCGLKNLKLKPKDSVDEGRAMRHIKAIIGSFELKHEYKEAGCAYLLSQWFDDASWERAKG